METHPQPELKSFQGVSAYCPNQLNSFLRSKTELAEQSFDKWCELHLLVLNKWENQTSNLNFSVTNIAGSSVVKQINLKQIQ